MLCRSASILSSNSAAALRAFEPEALIARTTDDAEDVSMRLTATGHDGLHSARSIAQRLRSAAAARLTTKKRVCTNENFAKATEKCL